MPLGMVNQFSPLLQMPQGAQIQGNLGGMPMGYMMLNQDQLRQMSPTPPQLLQLQMQMMKNGVMPGTMQMPKNDVNNDPNKK
jgi:hypothetical protein